MNSTFKLDTTIALSSIFIVIVASIDGRSVEHHVKARAVCAYRNMVIVVMDVKLAHAAVVLQLTQRFLLQLIHQFLLEPFHRSIAQVFHRLIVQLFHRVLKEGPPQHRPKQLTEKFSFCDCPL